VDILEHREIQSELRRRFLDIAELNRPWQRPST
jgi:hypothetical protein